MKLKQKSQMTGRELCDLEGYIFPILASFDEANQEAQKKAFLDLVKTDGEEITKLCYTKDDGAKLEEINEAYRFTLMTDLPNILSFIMKTEEQETGKPQTKTRKIPIKR
jgi:hypothetical protein